MESCLRSILYHIQSRHKGINTYVVIHALCIVLSPLWGMMPSHHFAVEVIWKHLENISVFSLFPCKNLKKLTLNLIVITIYMYIRTTFFGVCSWKTVNYRADSFLEAQNTIAQQF